MTQVNKVEDKKIDTGRSIKAKFRPPTPSYANFSLVSPTLIPSAYQRLKYHVFSSSPFLKQLLQAHPSPVCICLPLLSNFAFNNGYKFSPYTGVACIPCQSINTTRAGALLFLLALHSQGCVQCQAVLLKFLSR